MAVRIELRVDGRLVGGAEQWWDDVEAALRDGEAPISFPLLGRVDPFGDVSFAGDELGPLAVEARLLSTRAAAPARLFLAKLADLCEEAHGSTASELRFLGD